MHLQNFFVREVALVHSDIDGNGTFSLIIALDITKMNFNYQD